MDRNTVKRRLRHLARTELLPALSTVDVVLRAMPSAYGASFDELRASVRQVLKKLPHRDAEASS